MNEVFERLSDVFEELRSDAGEQEYSIQTEEAKKADKELKKKTGNMKNSYLTFLQSREIFRKLYGYCRPCTLSGTTESLLSGDSRCSTDTCWTWDC